MNQGDLFGELASKIADPIIGMRIKLDPCRCRCDVARIVKGQWLNVPFACEDCGLERGRLDYTTQRFIREFIKLIGQPTSPIELRHGNYIETPSQPSGAGAETSSHAPTRN